MFAPSSPGSLRDRLPRRWSLRAALHTLSLPHDRNATLPEPSPGPPRLEGGMDDQPLPAIVIKAQDDARCRQALARIGYSRVRALYLRHKRQATTFDDLEDENLWPSLEFVADWLRQERARVVARNRFPFLMAMLATIVAGLAYIGVVAVLG